MTGSFNLGKELAGGDDCGQLPKLDQHGKTDPKTKRLLRGIQSLDPFNRQNRWLEVTAFVAILALLLMVKKEQDLQLKASLERTVKLEQALKEQDLRLKASLERTVKLEQALEEQDRRLNASLERTVRLEQALEEQDRRLKASLERTVKLEQALEEQDRRLKKNLERTVKLEEAFKVIGLAVNLLDHNKQPSDTKLLDTHTQELLDLRENEREMRHKLEILEVRYQSFTNEVNIHVGTFLNRLEKNERISLLTDGKVDQMSKKSWW
jgi:hypothetical protein